MGHSFFELGKKSMMTVRRECSQCGSIDVDSFATLKHVWHHCNECSSIRASLRSNTALNIQPFKTIIKFITYISKGHLRVIEKNYLIGYYSNEQSGGVYGRYAQYIKNPSALSLWDGQAEYWMKDLANRGIEHRGKKILFISGGPGVIAKEFAKSSEVYATEFDQESVDAMSNILHLKTKKFDVNSDTLSGLFKTQFDIVFAESMINYCNDQDAFFSDLKRCIAPNGVLIVNSDIPTLGYMITWQFVDYIPFNFLSHDGFKNLFLRHNFVMIGKTKSKYNSLVYRFSLPGLKNKVDHLLRFPFWLIYGLRFILLNKNLNRKFWSLSITYILKKKDA